MKIVSCAICGKKFETARPNKKYCCFSCKEAGRQLQRMKWNDKNPNYSKKYMREYRTKNKTKERREDAE